MNIQKMDNKLGWRNGKDKSEKSESLRNNPWYSWKKWLVNCLQANFFLLNCAWSIRSDWTVILPLGAFFILRKGVLGLFRTTYPSYVRTFSLHKVSDNWHFLNHPSTSMSLRIMYINAPLSILYCNFRFH